MSKRQNALSQEKKCPLCQQTLDKKFFHISRRASGRLRLSGYCKLCAHRQNVVRLRNIKHACVVYKGGKCVDCAFIGHDSVFDFHHLDPEQKDIDISVMKHRKFGLEMQKELDKCVLLCANCHRIRHAIK